MIDVFYQRYNNLEKQLETDPELCFLRQQLQEKEAAFQELLSQLPDAQRSAITDYIGTCAEIDQRIVEIACF